MKCPVCNDSAVVCKHCGRSPNLTGNIQSSEQAENSDAGKDKRNRNILIGVILFSVIIYFLNDSISSGPSVSTPNSVAKESSGPTQDIKNAATIYFLKEGLCGEKSENCKDLKISSTKHDLTPADKANGFTEGWIMYATYISTHNGGKWWTDRKNCAEVARRHGEITIDRCGSMLVR